MLSRKQKEEYYAKLNEDQLHRAIEELDMLLDDSCDIPEDEQKDIYEQLQIAREYLENK